MSARAPIGEYNEESVSSTRRTLRGCRYRPVSESRLPKRKTALFSIERNENHDV